jgi:pilus assembly protein CpaE
MSDQAEQVYAEVVRWKPTGVIIAIDTETENKWTLCRQINNVCPETVIICASRRSSPDLILDSLRSGAREFLRLPAIHDELKTVIDRTLEFCAGQKVVSKKHGRVISLYSSKGGCGTSFIAANLAAALGAPTVLVDLNLQAGSQDIFFGAKHKFSIVDLIKNRTRLDDRLLDSYLVQHSPNLVILPAPQDAETAEEVVSMNVIEVIDLLRERYEFVVLDLPHNFDAVTIAGLDQSDDILVIMTLDILATRAAQRSLTILRRLGYAREKIRLVINRCSKQSDLEIKHVERFLNERIASFISEDYKSVVNSINLGKPLVESNPSVTIAAELNRLAIICGAVKGGGGETRRNLLGSLFRKRAQTGAEELQPLVEKGK